MGTVLVVHGADFSGSKTHSIEAQRVTLGTVYKDAHFSSNGQIRQFDSDKTASDYPDIPFAQIMDTQPWTLDYALAYAAIPDGAVAVGGISAVYTYDTSNNTIYNGLPVVFKDLSGANIATLYGRTYNTLNGKNYTTTDDLYSSSNTASDRMYDTMRVLGVASGVSVSGAGTVRRIQFVADIPPTAKHAYFSWFLPKAVTAAASTTKGGSTLGVGVTVPELYWLFG